MSDPRNGNWDKQIEYDLPDCRVRYASRERDIVYLGRMAMEKVFCANCGDPVGLVTAEWTPHVFAICDKCVAINGRPRGVTEIPKNVVEGRQLWDFRG